MKNSPDLASATSTTPRYTPSPRCPISPRGNADAGSRIANNRNLPQLAPPQQSQSPDFEISYPLRNQPVRRHPLAQRLVAASQLSDRWCCPLARTPSAPHSRRAATSSTKGITPWPKPGAAPATSPANRNPDPLASFRQTQTLRPTASSRKPPSRAATSLILYPRTPDYGSRTTVSFRRAIDFPVGFPVVFRLGANPFGRECIFFDRAVYH